MSPSLWKQDRPFSDDPSPTLTPAGAAPPWGRFPPSQELPCPSVAVPVPCPAPCLQLSLLTQSFPPLHPQLLPSLPQPILAFPCSSLLR